MLAVVDGTKRDAVPPTSAAVPPALDLKRRMDGTRLSADFHRTFYASRALTTDASAARTRLTVYRMLATNASAARTRLTVYRMLAISR